MTSTAVIVSRGRRRHGGGLALLAAWMLMAALVLAVPAASAQTSSPEGLWDATHTPEQTDCGPFGSRDGNGFCTINDNGSVALGVRFVTSETVNVVGVRVYRVDSGTVTGTLWTGTGTELATGDFGSFGGNGWQDLMFTSPVQISPGQVYVASYYAPNADYAYEYEYFTNSGRTVGPITALDTTTAGGNGVYVYADAFPTSTFRATNYWVTPLWEDPNNPPVADANGPYLVAAGSTVAFDGTGSTDPDGDTLQYEWSVADGVPTTLSGATPTYTAPAVAGIYDVTLAVDDQRGAQDTDQTTVVVYDPSAGFVTGGGWINSPAGAYTADPELAGKATFGFVSKYRRGANTPDGNTEFQFRAADLNFRSTSYEWLVVAGTSAQFRGEGTINGQGSYRFRLSADDDSPDTFRIQIWGDSGTVYDNGSQQALGGGSIVIHTRG